MDILRVLWDEAALGRDRYALTDRRVLILHHEPFLVSMTMARLGGIAPGVGSIAIRGDLMMMMERPEGMRVADAVTFHRLAGFDAVRALVAGAIARRADAIGW